MAGDSAPSGATMVDAQLTNARILKPFDGFERVYQGQPSLVPIAFPGTRDLRALGRTPGYDPNLLIGIPVPDGARVVLWFPMCFSPDPPGDPNAPWQFYSYRLVWRYQNLSGYNNAAVKKKRAPFHFPQSNDGAPDTTSGTPLARIVLPASNHVIAYEEAEPATGAGNLVVRVETITPRLDALSLFIPPLLPDGQVAVVEQGALDPATNAVSKMPIYVPFWTDAEGDELIILANRTGSLAEDSWDFTDPAVDLAFSNVYGTGDGAHQSYRDVGIYLQTGTMP